MYQSATTTIATNNMNGTLIVTMETNKKKREKLGEVLPLSLIESEILPRLSIKSLGRCICVSKQWKSFLSTPTFAKMHRQYHVPTINDYNVLVLHDDDSDDDGQDNPIPGPGDDGFVIGSLDGLVCFAGSSPTNDEPELTLTFWNPLTGAYKKLSPNPHDPAFIIGLDTDSDAFGFYLDNDSNDYKLLHLSLGGYIGAYIYSHRLDSWREIFFPYKQLKFRLWSEATFCGHCLYFTVTDDSARFRYGPPSDPGRPLLIVVICFDVKTEKFKKIELPPVPDPARYYRASLVVLDGCVHLCASYTYVLQDGLQCERHGHLWRIDGDGDGWVEVQAAVSDPVSYFSEYYRKRGICTTSIDNWLAVLEEESDTFQIMNTEDFKTDYGCFCSASWEYRSRRIMCVGTLVSP